MGNNSCKSFNAYRNGNNAKKLCELNNNTRQEKVEGFYILWFSSGRLKTFFWCIFLCVFESGTRLR